MRALAFTLLLLFSASPLLFSASPLRAQDMREVRDVISRQLEAFAHDDAAAAFSLAAPGIRDKFASPDVFMEVVKSAYPPVYRHRSVQFGPQSQDGDKAEQSVTFIDPDNVVWKSVYRLERQTDGGWRILGCVIARSEETSL